MTNHEVPTRRLSRSRPARLRGLRKRTSVPPPPGGTVDIGPVFFTAQPTIDHTFTIVNRRNYQVRLVGESHSCVCTQVDLKRGELLPGESTSLAIKVRVPPEYGRRSIVCVVQTDDPAFPEWVYRLVFEAFPEARIDPPQIKLGSFHLASDPGPPTRPILSESTLDVFTPDDRDIPTVKQIAATKGLDVQVGDQPQVDRLPSGIRRVRYPVRVRLTPHDSMSEVVPETYTVVLTNGASAAGNVVWRLERSLSWSPRQVHFGTLAPGARSTSRTVLLRTAGDAHFRLLSVESDDLIEVIREGEVRSSEPSRLVKLSFILTVPPTAVPRELQSGLIRVRTDLDATPEVRIPWSAFIR